MTFAAALALVRAAYALGQRGGEVEPKGTARTSPLRSRGPWWEASERLGLLHRAREQAKRHRPLLRDRWRVLSPARPQGEAL